jgi:hypothetical protein
LLPVLESILSEFGRRSPGLGGSGVGANPKQIESH